jgi:hypothetical protein
VTLLIGVALVLPAAGCHSCDRIESELRQRENDLREARAELEGAQAYNHALEAEVRHLRGEPPVAIPLPTPGLPPPPPPERPALTFPIKSLTLGRQTGGYDGDGQGDHGVQVVLEPRDLENQAVKAPGSAEVQVCEISPEGLKKPLSSWQIPPDQLRQSWRSGLLNTGYVLVLPWKTPPSTEKLRITARFILPDGRAFEADRDVTVRLPAGARHMPPAGPIPPPAAPIPAPTPEPDGDGPRLPPPKPLNPIGGLLHWLSPRHTEAEVAWWKLPAGEVHQAARPVAVSVERPQPQPQPPAVEILKPQPLP